MILLSDIDIAYAQTCEVSHIRISLRKALFDYFQNPETASLSLPKIKDLLIFYLNIPEGEIAADCSDRGWSSNVSYIDIVNEADNITVTIPVCPDGTKYGECSLARPRYCYAGSLVERCNICGCPSMRVCQKLQGNCVETTENITCHANSDCGTDGYVGNYFCKDGNVYRYYISHNCTNPGTINSACSSYNESVLIDACGVNETCIDGIASCQLTDNKPDLIITNMTWPSYIAPNKSFLVTMTIKNIGNAPFLKPDISITYAMVNPLTTPRCIHGGFSTPLLPGESGYITTYPTCVELQKYNKPYLNNYYFPEGTYEITAVIDYDNKISELNETNNNLTKTIIVGNPVGPTCIDSDTGKDYFVRGTIKSWNGTVESYDCCATTATDPTCVASSNYLAERYCTPSGFITEIYTCPSDCTDGACLRTVNKPDLIITNMTWPSYIAPNKSIYPVTMTIKNIGNASKPDGHITYAMVNPLTTPRCIHGGFWTSLLPGEIGYTTTSASCAELQNYSYGFPEGTYEITTVIDYDNILNEWNETNNNLTKTIVVGNP